MIKLGTLLYVWFCCKFVGKDQFGNKYYKDKNGTRTIIYNGQPEASKIPPLWHAWMHYLTNEIPEDNFRYQWQQEAIPNLTGTKFAYRPNGHILAEGKRNKATGDYEAWNPNGVKN